MTTIAELMVEVGANIGGFTSGMNTVEGRLSSVSGRLNQVGGSLMSSGMQLTMMTAPLLAIGAAGISAASSFEDVTAQLATFGGLAGAELEHVRQAALQMGADTMFSATDAANAMLEMVKAGQSVDQALASTNAVLELAAVGGMGMAEAAGVMSSALAVFNLEASDAGRVSDALARAASASRADVRGLGQALTNVGGVAAMFGLNIEETAATLGVFENAGISGAEAGTQLRSMLLNLTRNTEDVTGAWADLGISLYDTQGNIRDFDTIIDDLSFALEGMTDQQVNEYLTTLGGSYGIVGLQALMAAGGIDSMQAAMAGAPAASELAATAMNTFSGKVESLRGSVDTLMVNALTPLMDNILTPLAGKFTDVINGINDWVLKNPELTGQIVLLAGGALLLGPALMAVGAALKVIALPLGLVSTLFGLLTSPVGLVVAGFAGILALGGQLEPLFNGIKDALGPAINDALFGLSTAFNALTKGDTELGLMTLGTSLTVIKDALVQVAGLTFDSFVTALENITGLEISDGLAQVGDFLTQAAAWAGQNVLQPIVDGFNGLAGGVQGFMDTLGKDVDPKAIQAILDTVVQVGAAIGTLVAGLAQVGGEAIGATLKAVGDALPGLASGIASIINTVGGLLSGDINPVQALTDIGAAIGSIGTSLLSIPVGATDGLIESLNALDGEGGLDLPTLTETFNTLTNDVIQPFVDVLEGIGIVVDTILKPVRDWFADTFSPDVGGAVGDVNDGWDDLKTTLEGIWEAVRPGLESIVNFFNVTFLPIKTNVIDPIAQAIQGIITAAQTALDELRQLGGGVPGISLGEIPTGFLAPKMHAGGGPVMAGQPYIVGEKGPELMVPRYGGTIIPNGAWSRPASAGAGAAGAGVTVNVTAYGTDSREFADLVMTALRDRGL